MSFNVHDHKVLKYAVLNYYKDYLVYLKRISDMVHTFHNIFQNILLANLLKQYKLSPLWYEWLY